MAGRIKPILRFLRDVVRYVRFPVLEFRGVYRSFEEALAAAPRNRLTGFDQPELATSYVQQFEPGLSPYDYPTLFHLLHAQVGSGAVVVDFGGNIGTHYRQYARYLDLRGVRWIVVDVPAITAAGARECVDIPQVSFVHSAHEVGVNVDVLHASGVFQYLRETVVDVLRILSRSGTPPRHVILNRIPLSTAASFITLQNAGIVYYPQRVFNRLEFIQSIAAEGYTLVDEWDDLFDKCVIPFHRDKSVYMYTGLYFQSAAAITGLTR